MSIIFVFLALLPSSVVYALDETKELCYIHSIGNPKSKCNDRPIISSGYATSQELVGTEYQACVFLAGDGYHTWP